MFWPIAHYLRQQGWKDWTLAQIGTNGLVWWIFRPGDRTPAAIGKLPRTRRDTELARREAAALRQLEGADLRVPRLLFGADLDDGRFIFLQTAVPGRPVVNETRSVDGAARWIERFQGAIRPGSSVAEALSAAWERCAAALPDLRPEERTLIEAAQRLAAETASLPAVPVHGDFWAGNVLDSGGELAVIDWSNFHPGSPLEDLHNFAAAVPDEPADNETRARRMWDALFGETPLARATAHAAGRLLRARGLAPDDGGRLTVLFLLNRIACAEFTNHGAWRLLAARWVASGMPQPPVV